MPMVVSWNGTTTALGHQNYVQIYARTPCQTPRHTSVNASRIRPPAHSFNLHIGVDFCRWHKTAAGQKQPAKRVAQVQPNRKGCRGLFA